MLNRAFPAALALILGACSDDLPTADKPSSQPTAIVAQNGDGQTQVVDHMLANRLVARVTDARGRRVRNASVWFAVVAGGGTILSAATMRTDAAGLANAIWRLGTSTAVEQAVRARVSQHRTSGGWLDRASDGTAPMRSAAGARERGPALFLDNRYRAIPIASLYFVHRP